MYQTIWSGQMSTNVRYETDSNKLYWIHWKPTLDRRRRWDKIYQKRYSHWATIFFHRKPTVGGCRVLGQYFCLPNCKQGSTTFEKFLMIFFLLVVCYVSKTLMWHGCRGINTNDQRGLAHRNVPRIPVGQCTTGWSVVIYVLDGPSEAVRYF